MKSARHSQMGAHHGGSVMGSTVREEDGSDMNTTMNTTMLHTQRHGEHRVTLDGVTEEDEGDAGSM